MIGVPLARPFGRLAAIRLALGMTISSVVLSTPPLAAAPLASTGVLVVALIVTAIGLKLTTFEIYDSAWVAGPWGSLSCTTLPVVSSNNWNEFALTSFRL